MSSSHRFGRGSLAACGLSAALSDATGVIILLVSLCSGSFRPALSALIAFAMRWCVLFYRFMLFFYRFVLFCHRFVQFCAKND